MPSDRSAPDLPEESPIDGDLSAFFLDAPSALVVLDHELNVVHANRAFAELCRNGGAPRGRSFASLLSPEDAKVVEAAIRAETAGLGVRVRRNGHAIAVSLASRALTVGDRATYVVCLAETADTELDLFFRSSPDMVCIHDRDGTLKRVNATWTEILGWSIDELIGRRVMDLVHPADVAAVELALQELFGAGHPVQFEARYECKSGGHRTLRWSARSSPETEVVLASARDLTTVRELEERTRATQKLDALGRLAGGVAHDINNMLAVVFGTTDLMLDDLPPEDAMRADVEEIQSTARRCAALVRQLLTFSQRQAVEPVRVSLPEAVLSAKTMLVRLLGPDTTLEIASTEDACDVLIDPGQLEQLIVNLAMNARDAMSAGGKVSITTGRVSVSQDQAERADLLPGDYVSLSVADRGSGISPEILSKIFDPFFTSKPRGMGTGLGLSAVFGIVKQAGGGIEVETEIGKGSTFRVLLPPAKEGPPTGAKRVRAVPDGNEEHVLLVDDEPQVRATFSRILRDHGYVVHEARDGVDAVALAANLTRVDVLLSDVTMPRMDGFETAKQVLATHPSARVLFMSGYSDQPTPPDGVGQGGPDFLPKPFTARQLLEKIRAILDRV
jgi:PAS domain S-box-containing protein